MRNRSAPAVRPINKRGGQRAAALLFQQLRPVGGRSAPPALASSWSAWRVSRADVGELLARDPQPRTLGAEPPQLDDQARSSWRGSRERAGPSCASSSGARSSRCQRSRLGAGAFVTRSSRWSRAAGSHRLLVQERGRQDSTPSRIARATARASIGSYLPSRSSFPGLPDQCRRHPEPPARRPPGGLAPAADTCRQSSTAHTRSRSSPTPSEPHPEARRSSACTSLGRARRRSPRLRRARASACARPPQSRSYVPSLH